ncbi:hypothetical protein [uncultured Brevundimonas sp.]|uniref:phage fiber-tail adaptor protein n=1 Tax=uncultured Brevundimonas sp. TaxID=213418 RepID=UPI0025E2D8C6|nr:hypothetical protein [uncultured Brevundimonas sp.]
MTASSRSRQTPEQRPSDKYCMSLKFKNPKDPRAIATYTFNWTAEVQGDDTIVPDQHPVNVVTGPPEDREPDTNSDLKVETTQIATTAMIEGVETPGHYIVCVISGGTHGADYLVQSEINLTSGLRFNREAVLRVRNL